YNVLHTTIPVCNKCMYTPVICLAFMQDPGCGRLCVRVVDNNAVADGESGPRMDPRSRIAWKCVRRRSFEIAYSPEKTHAGWRELGGGQGSMVGSLQVP